MHTYWNCTTVRARKTTTGDCNHQGNKNTKHFIKEKDYTSSVVQKSLLQKEENNSFQYWREIEVEQRISFPIKFYGLSPFQGVYKEWWFFLTQRLNLQHVILTIRVPLKYFRSQFLVFRTFGEYSQPCKKKKSG